MLSNKVSEIMSRDLTAVGVSSTISEAMDLMAEKNIGRVLVVETGIPIGIFTEKDVLKRVMNKKLDAATTGIKKAMTSPVRSVREDTHIVEALGSMYKSKFRHLLVKEPKGKIVGMVSMRRILKLAVELGQGLKETQSVGSIMSSDPVTADLGQSVHDVIDLMVKKDAGCVVVLSEGKPAGIFTERDVLKRVATRQLDTLKTSVREVMTSPLVTLPHTALIGEVLGKMYQRSFRHMVIMGPRQELAGLVSMRDVLKYAKALDVDERVRNAWKEVEEFWQSEEQYTPG